MKKKQLKKKKTLKDTWDDSSTSKDEEPTNKEVANYALMALGDEISKSIEAHLSFNELLNDFHDLFNEYKLVSKKYKLLKKEHAPLVSDFDRLKIEHDDSLAPCTKCD